MTIKNSRCFKDWTRIEEARAEALFASTMLHVLNLVRIINREKISFWRWNNLFSRATFLSLLLIVIWIIWKCARERRKFCPFAMAAGSALVWYGIVEWILCAIRSVSRLDNFLQVIMIWISKQWRRNYATNFFSAMNLLRHQVIIDLLRTHLWLLASIQCRDIWISIALLSVVIYLIWINIIAKLLYDLNNRFRYRQAEHIRRDGYWLQDRT